MKACLDCGAELVFKPHQGDKRRGARLRCGPCAYKDRTRKANERAKARYARLKGGKAA